MNLNTRIIKPRGNVYILFLVLFLFTIKKVKASIENPMNGKFRKINTQSRNIRKFPCVEHRNVLCSFMLNVNLSFMVSYWCSGLYLWSVFSLAGWALSASYISCDKHLWFEQESQVHLSWNICTMARHCSQTENWYFVYCGRPVTCQSILWDNLDNRKYGICRSMKVAEILLNRQYKQNCLWLS